MTRERYDKPTRVQGVGSHSTPPLKPNPQLSPVTLTCPSALCGAMFMVAADTVARIVVAPAELPVGVVTALIGVPVFLWLLVRAESLG